MQGPKRKLQRSTAAGEHRTGEALGAANPCLRAAPDYDLPGCEKTVVGRTDGETNPAENRAQRVSRGSEASQQGRRLISFVQNNHLVRIERHIFGSTTTSHISARIAHHPALSNPVV